MVDIATIIISFRKLLKGLFRPVYVSCNIGTVGFSWVIGAGSNRDSEKTGSFKSEVPDPYPNLY
jgi:hypothetical protein